MIGVFLGNKMVFVITDQALIALLVWTVFAFLGLKMFYNFYQNVNLYDDFIHFTSGIVFAMILVPNFSIPLVLLINFIMALTWEWFQVESLSQIRWIQVGYKEGKFDILLHMAGTILFLIFI